MNLTGEIVKIGRKEGRNARGKWVLSSIKLALADGSESDWISVGFDGVGNAKEGDYVDISGIVANDKGYLNAKPQDIVPATRPVSNREANNSGVGQTETSADRNTSIILQHSQEMAIAVVGLLLENEALPMSEAKTKAGTAKRFEELVASVDKFTVKYYNDALTGRLLDTVADMGVVDTSADGPVPNVAPGNDADDE